MMNSQNENSGTNLDSIQNARLAALKARMNGIDGDPANISQNSRNGFDANSNHQTLSRTFSTDSGTYINGEGSLQSQMRFQEELNAEKQKRELAEKRFNQLREFTTIYIKDTILAKRWFQTHEINQKRTRLGDLKADFNGKWHWSRSVGVEQVEHEITALQTKAKIFSSGKDKDKEDAHIANINQAIKDHRAVLKQLDSERERFFSELRTFNEEENSIYRPGTELDKGRYILLSFAGRGGFSEVWRALDTAEGRNVAIKIQKMSENWTQEVKSNFVRHSGREILILRASHNPHVVEFYEHFYIGEDTLAMVMEFCPDGDLADLIRRSYNLGSTGTASSKQKGITEGYAKSVIGQVIAGLLALRSEDSKRVIHYDLKPANILFSGQVAKITDFGLSKVIEQNVDAIALTSQGTGTYYYAAPETLGQSSSTVMINSSVDTWALGIIFYEMLYGFRPFGTNNIPQVNLAGMTARDFATLSFPALPKGTLSKEAKDFITKCLEREPAMRMRLEDLAEDPYIKDFIS